MREKGKRSEADNIYIFFSIFRSVLYMFLHEHKIDKKCLGIWLDSLPSTYIDMLNALFFGWLRFNLWTWAATAFSWVPLEQVHWGDHSLPLRKLSRLAIWGLFWLPCDSVTVPCQTLRSGDKFALHRPYTQESFYHYLFSFSYFYSQLESTLSMIWVSGDFTKWLIRYCDLKVMAIYDKA